MKKLLLIAAVAMTATFTSCKKDDSTSVPEPTPEPTPTTVNLAEKICSMFNQPVDSALETAKSLGYTLIDHTGKVDTYTCYKDTSTATGKMNKIEMMFNDRNENRVVNVQYINTGTASEVASQAKSLTEQTGESRTLNNNLVEKFRSGDVDNEKGITTYSLFLDKIGNTTKKSMGSWVDSGDTAQIIVMVAILETGEHAVLYYVSIGG